MPAPAALFFTRRYHTPDAEAHMPLRCRHATATIRYATITISLAAADATLSALHITRRYAACHYALLLRAFTR